MTMRLAADRSVVGCGELVQDLAVGLGKVAALSHPDLGVVPGEAGAWHWEARSDTESVLVVWKGVSCLIQDFEGIPEPCEGPQEAAGAGS